MRKYIEGQTPSAGEHVALQLERAFVTELQIRFQVGDFVSLSFTFSRFYIRE